MNDSGDKYLGCHFHFTFINLIIRHSPSPFSSLSCSLALSKSLHHPHQVKRSHPKTAATTQVLRIIRSFAVALFCGTGLILYYSLKGDGNKYKVRPEQEISGDMH